MSVGKASAVGIVYSVNMPEVVTLATLFRLSTSHTFPSGPATIPQTPLLGVGIVYMVMRYTGPAGDDGGGVTGSCDGGGETGGWDGGNEAVWLGLASARRLGDAEPGVIALGIRPQEDRIRAATAAATGPTQAFRALTRLERTRAAYGYRPLRTTTRWAEVAVSIARDATIGRRMAKSGQGGGPGWTRTIDQPIMSRPL